MFIKKSILVELLNPFMGVIGKTAIPMTLTNIEIESDGTNLIARGAGKGMLITNTIPHVTDLFKILVNFETLQKTIKSHGATIELEINQKNIKTVSGKVDDTIPISDEGYLDFPTFVNKGQVLDKSFVDVLKQVILSSGDENFASVYFEGTELVSTNRQQITVGEFKTDESFILPVETATYLSKLKTDVSLLVEGGWIVFLTEGTQIITKPMVFDFPLYKNVIKTDEPYLTLSADTPVLKDALMNIILFNPDKARLQTAETGIVFKARGSKGMGEAEVPCDLDGKILSINFNPSVLLKYVRSRKAKRTFLTFAETPNRFKMIGMSSTACTHYIPELLN